MIRYFSENWALERKTDGASGYDLCADFSSSGQDLFIGDSTSPSFGLVMKMVIIPPQERYQIHTGLYLEMPKGVEGQVRSRSGLAAKHGVIVLNAPGTVDSDYRGEVIVTLYNADKREPYEIRGGDRIAQIVFAEVAGIFAPGERMPQTPGIPVRVKTLAELSSTDRGDSGHGSTGR